MYKILKFELILAEIFKKYWRQVKIEISNLLGFCDISLHLKINKQHSSCFISLSFTFFCLRKENIDSMEWIHANLGCKLAPNDANWGWNHDKIMQISPYWGKGLNLCKSEGSQGLRQPAKLSGDAPQHQLTMFDYSARLGYTWRASPINVV